MINLYISFVMDNPFLSAAIQFGILGTLGEVVSFSLIKNKLAMPCNLVQLLAKVLAWAMLGVFIKYGFVGMQGFSAALLEHQMLPQFFASGVALAFTISVVTNLFFGPQMMLLHRIQDNFILGEKNYQGLNKAWWTLIWFWIPAHTVTFSLAVEFQIGLAALWGMVLGLIMGYSKKHSEYEHGTTSRFNN